MVDEYNGEDLPLPGLDFVNLCPKCGKPPLAPADGCMRWCMGDEGGCWWEFNACYPEDEGRYLVPPWSVVE